MIAILEDIYLKLGWAIGDIVLAVMIVVVLALVVVLAIAFGIFTILIMLEM